MRPMHMIVVILATEPDLAQVVDPTGEIVLPADRRSKAWAATAGQTELGVEGLEARHIVGNY
jgi:hypothetical protein